MKLPFLQKKEKPQYFLALILRDDKAIAVVFEELLGKIKLIGQGEENFKTSIEEATSEELLDNCDKIISKAEEALPPNIETQKTIFSLKDSWISENKIKKEYLDKLKKASEELGLTPIGFLQTSEAMINLIQQEEGAPVTAVFTQVGEKNVIVSLLKAGKVTECKKSEIHESASFTVDTILKHFETPEVLPSRVIISTSEEDELSQEFISHQWSKSLPFLHLPQIQVLPEDFDVKAVMFGAAKQMGLELMPEFKKETVEEIKEMDQGNETEEQKEVVGENEEKEEELKEEPEPKGTDEEEADLEKFGFLEEDIAKIKTEKEEKPEETIIKHEHEPEIESIDLDNSDFEKKESSSKRKLPVEGAMILLSSALDKLKNVTTNNKIPSFKGKRLVIPIAILVFLLLVFGVLASFKKATINLTLSPKTENQTQSVTFSLTGSTDPENKLIASESIDDNQSGSVSITATGKKETGEPAKGNITFYSRFTQEKTIASGTVISSNNLDFSTDKDVKLASASADASAQPTTATVAVTAKKIGKESNLPSGTKFSVGNLSTSDIIAKNDNAFSGGTKKDITIVSKDDYETLQETLIKNLEQKAKDSIAKKISSDKNVLPVFIDATLEKKSYSKKVNEEANQVTLEGTVAYTGLIYNKKDLVSFTKSLITQSATDLKVDEKNLKTDVKDVKKKNDKQITASLKIDAQLLPKINEKDLINKLLGKPLKEAEAELRQINQVSDVNISISPPLPFITNSLPGSSDRILIKVSAND